MDFFSMLSGVFPGSQRSTAYCDAEGVRSPNLADALTVLNKMMNDPLSDAQKKDLNYVMVSLQAQQAKQESELPDILSEKSLSNAEDIDEPTKNYLIRTFSQPKAPRKFRSVAALVSVCTKLSIKSAAATAEEAGSPAAAGEDDMGDLPELTPQLRRELDKVGEWEKFSVFAVNKLSNGRPLFYTAWWVLQRHGLLKRFHIKPSAMQNFLTHIEAGYKLSPNPYHNNIHGADVTQSLHCILNRFPEGAFTDLEILGCILAAICHDFEHLGLTNSYMENSLHHRALVYNNQSVNEAHHIARAFLLICENEACNIFETLTDAQIKALRSQMIDMVLHTDMALHAKQVAEFQARAEAGQQWKLSEEVDAHKVLGMALHCADLGGGAKPTKLAVRWSARVSQEFLAQGDKEREEGRDISPLCDRHDPAIKLAKSQVGFFTFLVKPTFEALGNVCDMSPIVGRLEDNIAFWSKHAETMLTVEDLGKVMDLTDDNIDNLIID